MRWSETAFLWPQCIESTPVGQTNSAAWCCGVKLTGWIWTSWPRGECLQRRLRGYLFRFHGILPAGVYSDKTERIDGPNGKLYPDFLDLPLSPAWSSPRFTIIASAPFPTSVPQLPPFQINSYYIRWPCVSALPIDLTTLIDYFMDKELIIWKQWP